MSGGDLQGDGWAGGALIGLQKVTPPWKVAESRKLRARDAVSQRYRYDTPMQIGAM